MAQLSKNLTGKALYRVILEVEAVAGLNFDPGFVGGVVTLKLSDLTTKSLTGQVSGISTDLVELTCAAKTCEVSMAKKVSEDKKLEKGKGGSE